MSEAEIASRELPEKEQRGIIHNGGLEKNQFSKIIVKGSTILFCVGGEFGEKNPSHPNIWGKNPSYQNVWEKIPPTQVREKIPPSSFV